MTITQEATILKWNILIASIAAIYDVPHQIFPAPSIEALTEAETGMVYMSAMNGKPPA